ncbi:MULTISPECIES: SH3 domain-containing protein [Streptomyces]|uniref:SH3 domain-containing protein n=1 Tax=Streptomyces TaxID=1883 RepID=UPI00163CD41E|nr:MULTISPECIES: SH3 domain-containing protein [Streptomyces]MBC2875635.1 SH3 domain-containing protein [Streptomyces sp. TYQ1024]UBI37495.1 SH3 domain-containing protein [Streptomyces mobaraensis]UKW30084.1 SH3 domain-containing protein [Streptomyces sp. TYQ1024]
MASEEIVEEQDRSGAEGGSVVTDASSASSIPSVQAAADAVFYPLAPGYQVNVRSGPSTSSQLVKILPQNTRVAIRCQTRGETVSGPCGTTNIWDNIAPGQYVSDAYVKTGSSDFVTVRCA